MAAARTEQEWLDSARTLILRGENVSAQAVLDQALSEFPASTDLLRAQAGLFQKTGRDDAAEQALRELLAHDAGDTGSAFALARTLDRQGRTNDAAQVLRACLAVDANSRDPDLAITAIELLDGMDRKRDAAAIAETAIAARPDDPRLHAYAGMLAIQLGEFDKARARYLFALRQAPRAVEWHVPIGLSSAQRYANPDHPDFALFQKGLERGGISDLARAELHFSLGKAYDDVGHYAEAARHFREGNAIRKRTGSWSRKDWRRMLETRLAAKPIAAALEPMDRFVPVFIVGMPRSGTTLLAELLSRHPRVCNRGELGALARLAQQPALSGSPTRPALQDAATTYTRRSRQDDAPEARWFIDKQPLNFRYVDLALAMFPDAKVIHCQRRPRDTALSLWMQCFLEDVQGYAYDFGDIALVMRDCERLMAHWTRLYPDSIRAVRYEELVANPAGVVAALAHWIGIQPRPLAEIHSEARPKSTISTASLWQARQPVHAKSVNRWVHYAQFVPELLQIPET